MTVKIIHHLVPAAIILSIIPCSCSDGSVWSLESSWFRYEGSGPDPDEKWADVFYLVSTNILSERDGQGDTLYLASLSLDQKAALSQEIGYVAKHVFNDSMNFFSPFYHQHTMEAIGLSPERYETIKEQLAEEVYGAFSYYIDNLNQGRPFILAGFSQGAMLVKEILKRMTPEQHSRMAAAYLLGWGLNEKDMEYPFIRPARSAGDSGVTISYNTVADSCGIWSPVMDNAAYCINPVNWATDSTPIDFEYNGQTLNAHVDTLLNVLMVSGFTPEPLPFIAPWQDGCLHHYEFLFFEKQLRENAKLRAYRGSK